MNALYNELSASLRPRERRSEVEKALGFHLHLSRIENEGEDAFSQAGDGFGAAVDTQGVRALLQHHWAERRRLVVFPINHALHHWKNILDAYLNRELKGRNVPEDVHTSYGRKSLQISHCIMNEMAPFRYLPTVYKQKETLHTIHPVHLNRNKPHFCKSSTFVFVP